jgi:hypothetical protein
MAGPAPKTKNWTARENKHKPKGLHIIVCGLVQVSATNKKPVLTKAPGIGDLLALDLKIDDTGQQGAQIVVWMQADFHTEVRANQYNRVVVRWDGKPIATFPVIDDREHSALMTKQCAVQNAVAAKKTGAPKKPAAKKAAAKKKAPKAAGGWAKKKVAKKAKKAAKKSAPKKAARKRAPAKKKKSKKR